MYVIITTAGLTWALICLVLDKKRILMDKSKSINIEVRRHFPLRIVQSLGFMGMALKLSPLDKILTWMVPKSLIEQMNEHQEYANAKLARRLDRTDGRQDLQASPLGSYPALLTNSFQNTA